MSRYQILALRNGLSGSQAGSMLSLCYRAVVTLIPGFVLFGVTQVSAQVSSVEINYFGRCRQVFDDKSRLACYDDLYDRAVRAANPQADSARLMEENRRMREELARIREDTVSVPAGTKADIKDFGMAEPHIVKHDDGKEELVDRIASLQQTPDGWMVTLESGQVWKQVNSKRYNLRRGQEVILSPSMFGGSYHLSVKELGGFIQVTRIK